MKKQIVINAIWKHIESSAQNGTKIIIDERTKNKIADDVWFETMKLVKGVYRPTEPISPIWTCFVGKRKIKSTTNRYDVMEKTYKITNGCLFNGGEFDLNLITMAIMAWEHWEDNEIGRILREKIKMANYYAK